jgi:hypothetical protein
MSTPVLIPTAPFTNPFLDEMRQAVIRIRNAHGDVTRSILQSAEVMADARRVLAAADGVLKFHQTVLLDMSASIKLMSD